MLDSMPRIKKPGPKPKLLVSTAVDVCGVDPKCDSAACRSASMYRYKQGCRGTACVIAKAIYTANG